jgi:hypothetical protein
MHRTAVGGCDEDAAGGTGVDLGLATSVPHHHHHHQRVPFKAAVGGGGRNCCSYLGGTTGIKGESLQVCNFI